MTQEEKARAYDAALERARELHDVGNALTKMQLGIVFPQLVESEDERIRKWLIKTVRLIGVDKDICADQETMDKAIAYLEKQKDASKAIEAVDRIDKYIDEHLANAHDMKDSNPDKKYYRGWDDALGKMAGILQDVYSNEKQKEQKPAEWSEEDEMYLSQAIETLEHENYSILSDKLKSIRSRVGKDSLQTHWKPSEEQMEALQNAVALAAGNKVLAGLYEHLLKSYRI